MWCVQCVCSRKESSVCSRKESSVCSTKECAVCMCVVEGRAVRELSCAIKRSHLHSGRSQE